MSTTTHTPTTKREVLIAREAYERGAYDAHTNQRETRRACHSVGFYDSPSAREAYLNHTRLKEAVRAEYPLPKVTRPRVLRESGDFLREYRVVDGGIELELQYRSGDHPEWRRLLGKNDGCWDVTPERARIWADLFANPTEEVEDTE